MITQIPTSLSNPHSSPFSTVEEEQEKINQKRKREEEEEEEMGCEPSQQTNNIPHSQFHPTTPEKSTNCFSNPKIAKRMQESTCYKCGQEGHWSWFCTNNNNNKHSPVSASKKIHCRCGHGFCDVRISGSERNKDRLYFACPIKMGKPCSTFVKWCDDRIDERDLQRPLIMYPECECGAGVCRREMEGAKYYFICPIKQTHGNCGYRVSEDELLNKASNDEPVNKTSIGNDLSNDMAEGCDLLLTTKRMRITDGSENPSPVAVSEIPEGKSGGSPIEETNSQPVGFPEIEFEDDQELINLASWAAIEAKDFPSSCFSTPSRISCRPSVYPRDIFSADASFEMANLRWKFCLRILIGVLLLTNNANTIAARYASIATPPTCMKHGCDKDPQNNLSQLLPRSFDKKVRLSSNSIHYFMQPSNYVIRIFRDISDGLDPRHHSSLRLYNPYHIARLVPQGPNPIHNR